MRNAGARDRGPRAHQARRSRRFRRTSAHILDQSAAPPHSSARAANAMAFLKYASRRLRPRGSRIHRSFRPRFCSVKRPSSRDRAQKNLQAAIAANIVEGRPVLNLGIESPVRNRAGQGRQSMDDHFRIAGGARCEQYPFGDAVSGARSRALARAAAGMARSARRRPRAAARRSRHRRLRRPERRGSQRQDAWLRDREGKAQSAAPDHQAR